MFKLFALLFFVTSVQALPPVSPNYMLTPGVIDPRATVKKICKPHYTETVTTPYNAHDKDALENKLHKMVCDGEITLIKAQAEIAKDWIKAHQD